MLRQPERNEPLQNFPPDRRKVGVSMLLAVGLLSGCTASSSGEPAPSASAASATPIVEGFAGGCEEGAWLYAQNDYLPGGAVLKVEPNQDADRVRDYGLVGNQRVKALGFVGVESVGDTVLYPENPEGARGETWILIVDPKTGEKVWASGSAMRSDPTELDEASSNETLENPVEVHEGGDVVVAGLEACELTPSR